MKQGPQIRFGRLKQWQRCEIKYSIVHFCLESRKVAIAKYSFQIFVN